MDEAEIRARCERGDLDGAVTIALEMYASQLFGFLCGLARDRTHAEDVFSATCERIWRGLARFRWDSTFRVWAYRIARNEYLRSTRETRRARQTIPLTELSTAQSILARVRTTTPFHEQTEVRDRYAAIRAQLDDDDLVLLGLRIENQLAWGDIAKVMAATEESVDATVDAKELAALRKRFERLKVKLRDLARSSA